MTTRPDTKLTDGLFLREFRPARTPRGAFLLLHGMESHSGWFAEIAMRLVQDGWAVLAFDRPGWGKSPGKRGHLEQYGQIVETVAKLATNAREKYGAVHLAGMSWGGMAALYVAMRRGWLFNSVACITPGLAAKRDLPFSGKVRIASGFFRHDLSRMIEPVFHPDHFTSDPEWRQYIADDPDRVRSVSASFCIETLKMRRFIKENIGKRQLPPTICLLAGNDAIIDNGATAALCRKAGIAVEIIPDTAHTLIFERPEQTAAILSRHAAGTDMEHRGGRAWVIGAGAVGGAIGALLAFGGVETGVLVKQTYLDTMREEGLHLATGHAKRSTDSHISFASNVDNLPPNPDLAVIAVKSFDTASALSGICGKLPRNTVIASLQNGVGNEEVIANAFPDHTIVAASICASLEMTRPGHTLWADDRGGLGAALHCGSAEIGKTVWQGIMSLTGMECRWFDGPDAGRRVKWSKLMLNTGFNALNSLTGLSSAELLADPVFGGLAIEALREGFSVMAGQQLDPLDLPGFPVSKLRYLLKLPTPLVRNAMSWQAARAPEASFSMRQDKIKKRQYTEIKELNGKIVELGKRMAIPTPANEKLVEFVEHF